MSHYDSFYQDSVNLWNDSIQDVCHEDCSHKECYFMNTKTKCLKKIKISQKHFKDKPFNARYCFLEAIRKNELDAIGYKISEIVNIFDRKGNILEYITRLQYDILACDTKLNIISDLITLRQQALDTKKYTIEGYKEKIDVSLLLDALARHYIKWVYVSDKDEESGCLHLSHMLANLIIINYQVRTYYE